MCKGKLDDRKPHGKHDNYVCSAVHSIIANEYSIFHMKIKNRLCFNQGNRI